jgi:hypothetical protein
MLIESGGPAGPRSSRPFGLAGTPATAASTNGWRSFTERGKNPLVANVAIARELAGWCWSLATRH